ncbi:MAG: hypothetical protein DRI97_13085 [Bacteroidetes bacterium]|nr:MAG: hypothetical protein DRI97_13085 [Bacteroidota bacterium]RLD95272.1 MAG: hypothetical protein DRJ13_14325 [Bacteroidota bacterium]
MILTGCNLGKKSEGEGSGDFEASGTLDTETQEQLNTAKRIFYALPSPLETAMLIKNAGAAYNEELMNPVSNSSKYITSKSKALNLGIYSTDLSYASLFDQSQATLDYVGAAKEMADGLNILDAINEETVTQLEEQINNRDAIIDIISETLMNSSSFLKENDLEGTASVVLVGGWIEGLYIATNLVNEHDLEDNKLVERIVDQKLSLDIMINLLESSPEDADAQAVLEDVKALKTIFDKITIDQGEVTAVEDPETNVTTLKSESSIKITNRVFTELKTKVIEIRNSYIS